MKKTSKLFVFLFTISIFPDIHASWFSKYFGYQVPTESAEDSGENAYISEVAPFSEQELAEYKKLSYTEDMEDFINKKLQHLYVFHSKNPTQFGPKNLENIRTKIQNAYQNATPSAYIQFYPYLKRFAIFPYYEDARPKQNELLNLEKPTKETKEECIKIQNEANEKCEKLTKKLSQEIKEKLGDFRTSKFEREQKAKEVAEKKRLFEKNEPKRIAKNKELLQENNGFLQYLFSKNPQKRDVPNIANMPRM